MFCISRWRRKRKLKVRGGLWDRSLLLSCWPMFLVARVNILSLFSRAAVEFLVFQTNQCLFLCSVWGFFSCSISIRLSCRSVPNIIVIFSASQYPQPLLILDKVADIQPLQGLAWYCTRRFSYRNNSVPCWFLLSQSSYIRMKLDSNRSQPESIPTISPAIRTTCWELRNSWILGERNYRHKTKIK